MKQISTSDDAQFKPILQDETRGSIDIICLCNYHGVGGAQLNAGLLTDEFIKRGYRAELGFLFEREVDAQHGSAKYFVCSKGKPRTFLDVLNLLIAIRRNIIVRRPKAVIGFFPLSNVVGALAAFTVRGGRMIATQRNPSNEQSKFTRAIDRLFGMTRLYSANIAVSNAVAESFAEYPERYRNKLKVVHNATPRLPSVDDDKTENRLRFGMGGGLVLGVLGRLHPQKNPRFVLEIAAILPEAELYFAGEGPLLEELKSHAISLGVEDRVHFLGSIRGSDITRFYKAIDVLLFPSIYEGFGRVLVEAMSQGVPIVANDIPVTREVGGVSVLFRSLEAEQWVKAIIDVKPGAPARHQAISSGLEQARKFTLEQMVDGYLDLAGLPRQLSGDDS